MWLHAAIVAGSPSGLLFGQPAGAVSPEVHAVVKKVLDSGHHPWLSWPEVTGVLPDLKALYAAEPDGLFWFTGEAGDPAVAAALDTMTRSDTLGFVPADYDAPKLADKWRPIQAGPATPAERAHFDYYGHDAKLEKALAGGYPYPRKS